MSNAEENNDFERLVDTDDPHGDTQHDPPTVRGRWSTIVRRGKVLWIGAAAGILLLVGGLLMGRFILPANSSGDAPAAGLVTVPVKKGTLESIVTVRGQVGFADATDVTIDPSSFDGPAVVTGHVPQAGAQLDALSIALETAGRPLIVLPGAVAAYRTLTYGMSGPDIAQYKHAMRAVGLDAGDPANPVFDEAAASAVSSLYSKAGYSAPEGKKEAASAVMEAEAALQSAEDGLAMAQNTLDKASRGPLPAEIQAADNAVRSAQRALDSAQKGAGADPAVAGAPIGDLEDALALALTQQQDLSRAPDTSAEEIGVRSATAGVEQAQATLDITRQDALPTLPLNEVLFVKQLPARVDSVGATLGSALTASAMKLSGTTLGMSGSVDPGDAALLTVGDAATFELPNGGTHAASVAAVTPGATAQDRPTVALTPAELSADEVTQLAGQNVKVTVPVGATSGEVLSVPEAALSAGPGGETRIQVVDGDPRDGDRAKTHLVPVTTGLAAQGQVEVTSTSGDLAADDLVVVAR